jgi:hypothetical protein
VGGAKPIETGTLGVACESKKILRAELFGRCLVVEPKN